MRQWNRAARQVAPTLFEMEQNNLRIEGYNFFLDFNHGKCGVLNDE
jgi:hypothetical protein